MLQKEMHSLYHLERVQDIGRLNELDIGFDSQYRQMESKFLRAQGKLEEVKELISEGKIEKLKDLAKRGKI